jgi:hypothetical protein
MKAQLADRSSTAPEAIGRAPPAAIVFHSRLQLFVPFAQKDARLEDGRFGNARLGGRATEA